MGRFRALGGEVRVGVADMNKLLEYRSRLAQARRVVVKIGSRVLVRSDGRPDPRRIRNLVREIARQQRAGREMAIVSSGAIATGMEALALSRRPKELADLQMAAAVGQTRLMTRYDQYFAAEQCRVGQVLLTHDALRQRQRHLMARQTLLNLLRHRIVPVINENDAIAVEEIRFGDNDLLGALVSLLIEADLLILLTTVDGLRAPAAGGRTRRVAWLRSVTRRELAMVFGDRNELSTGGMASKLQSAHSAARSGVPVVIADGRRPENIRRILAGEDCGTLIGQPGASPGWTARRRWIAFFHKSEGSVTVDEGACRALTARGTSLLPIGVRAVEGRFASGAVIDVRAPDGTVIARGWTDFAADEIRRIMGRRTSEIAAALGSRETDEVIHRDNMVVFGNEEGNES